MRRRAVTKCMASVKGTWAGARLAHGRLAEAARAPRARSPSLIIAQVCYRTRLSYNIDIEFLVFFAEPISNYQVNRNAKEPLLLGGLDDETCSLFLCYREDIRRLHLYLRGLLMNSRIDRLPGPFSTCGHSPMFLMNLKLRFKRHSHTIIAPRCDSHVMDDNEHRT